MASLTTLILLPTYEEAENLRLVVPRIRAAVPDADILVVDDNSPDGTAEVAERLGDAHGRVRVLRRPRKEGLGAAYRSAIRWALDEGYEVIVQMDSDLSHDPDTLPALIGAVEDGADLAIGSRYVPGGSIPDWRASRRLLSRYGNVYVRLLLGLPTNDTTTGFRAWRSVVVDKVGVTETTADGYGFMIECIYGASREGLRIVEVPIRFLDRKHGRSKMSGRIVVEALALVSWWALRDRVLHRRHRAR